MPIQANYQLLALSALSPATTPLHVPRPSPSRPPCSLFYSAFSLPPPSPSSATSPLAGHLPDSHPRCLPRRTHRPSHQVLVALLPSTSHAPVVMTPLFASPPLMSAIIPMFAKLATISVIFTMKTFTIPNSCNDICAAPLALMLSATAARVLPPHRPTAAGLRHPPYITHSIPTRKATKTPVLRLNPQSPFVSKRSELMINGSQTH